MMTKSEASRLLSQANSFERICELTVMWLHGEIPMICGQDAPPDDETAVIADHLVTLNQHGFLTSFSQPASPLIDGSGQRACVEGLASPELASRIAALSLHTDLVVLTAQWPYDGPALIPITIDEGRLFTDIGPFWDALLDYYRAYVPEEVTNELESYAYVAVIDPVWGRADCLWEHVVAVVEGRHPDNGSYSIHRAED